MKFPHLRSIGREAGWYRVGPLARVQNCDRIPSPRAEAERQAFIAWGRGEPVHATLAYHWARMIEVLHCVEVIATLLDDPDILAGELMHGGGVRTGGGLIAQAQWIGRYELSPSLALQLDAGWLRSPDGVLSTPMLALHTVYSFSRLQAP